MVIALSVLLILFFLPEAVSPDSAEQLYEEALFKKEAQGDLEGAIQLFLKITIDFPEERETGARAQLQVGICYEKLGTEQALNAYQRVVDEYPEQTDEVRLAREKIAALIKAQTLLEKPAREFTIRRLWSGPDVDFFGSPSPDGRYLSYVDWKTGELAIHDLATGKKHHLTHEATWDTPAQYAFHSRISPDGKQIAFCWFTELLDDDHSIDLRLIGLDGSSPRILCSDRDFEIFPAQWSPDGEQIAVRMYGRKDKKFQIAQVSVSDGSLHVIKQSEVGQTTQDCLSYSSDGQYIAFDLPVQENSDKYDIHLLAADGSGEIPLIEHPANDRLLGWAPGRKEVVFTSDRTETTDLWMVQVEDGRPVGSPRMIKSDIGRICPLGFIQSGALLFGLSQSWFNSSVAAIDRKEGEFRVSLKQPFLGSNRCPQWSPNGAQMAYISTKLSPAGPGFYDEIIHIHSFETGEDRELSCELNFLDHPRWSPDGLSIMVTSFKNLKGVKDYVGGLFEIDTGSGKVNQFAEYAHGSLGAGGWSRISSEWSVDGSAVFYVNQNCILKHELKSGLKKQLYCDPNIQRDLALSPDGNNLLFELYDTEEASGKLMIIPASGGAANELVIEKKPGLLRTFDWSSDGEKVYFARDEEYGTSFWEISSEEGKPQMLWKTDKKINGLDVHPAGNEFAFHEYKQVAEIWMIENFLPPTRTN